MCIQEGKETGQGVGYLDDGTMVVVEAGRELHRADGDGDGDEGAADGGRADDLRPPCLGLSGGGGRWRW